MLLPTQLLFIDGEESIGTPTLWTVFFVLVGSLLLLDLLVVHRGARQKTFREALGWSIFWIGTALAFNVWLYFKTDSSDLALQFFTGYLVEKSLSVDNLFVFIVVFRYFHVPMKYQHRVLFWGILGAIVFRFIFIYIGAQVVQRFHWVLLIFAALLFYSGIKLLFHHDAAPDLEKNRILRLFRRLVPTTTDFHDARMLVRIDGRLLATPLLAVLVVVETTDIAFAIDSIPAIFGITRDPYIVFSSNILAILGLRALYFLLAGVIEKFHYLHVGLSLVLIFIGVKMGLEFTPIPKIPILWSLGVIAVTLTGSVVASVLWPARDVPEPSALEDSSQDTAEDTAEFSETGVPAVPSAAPSGGREESGQERQGE